MKFRIIKTSDHYDPYDADEDLEEQNYEDREFNSLEELMTFVSGCKHNVIIRLYHDYNLLEIYDDYRE